MTDRCGCVLPFYLTDTPVQCGCGQWHAATTFHDHELETSWRGWDVMPDPRSTWSALDECERLPGCCSDEHQLECPEVTT